MLSMGFPLIYQQGPGLINRIGELVAMFGDHPLVVVDAFVKEHFGAGLEASLAAQSIHLNFFHSLENPARKALRPLSPELVTPVATLPSASVAARCLMHLRQ